MKISRKVRGWEMPLTACGLGADYYNLPGCWDDSANGQRWNYFRLESLSHNVPVFDGKNQDAYAKAKFIDFRSDDDSASCAIDWTEACREFGTNSSRKLVLSAHRRKLRITTFCMKTNAVLTWGITTKTDVRILSPDVAELSRDGKTMRVELRAANHEGFRVFKPTLESPQFPLENVSRLEADISMTPGPQEVSVVLFPGRILFPSVKHAKFFQGPKNIVSAL